MKKARIAVVALAVLMLFAAVSCKDEPVHQHVFDQKVAEEKYLAEKATEESPAKYYLSCECGEKGEETFEHGEHNHTYAEAWTTDAENHWHKCNGKDCKEIVGKAAHDFGAALENDETNHWKKCSVCGYEADVAAHILVDRRDDAHHWKECAVCGYKVGEVAHVYGTPYINEGLQVVQLCECGASKTGVAVGDQLGLNEAIEGGAKTIYIFTDFTLTDTVKIDGGKSVEINLNGKKVSIDADNKFAFTVDGAGSSLTISGDGSVEASYRVVRVVNDGKLVLDGGSYKSEDCAICIGAGADAASVTSGSAIINDAKVESREFCVLVLGDSKLVINGGVFSSADNAVIGTNGSGYFSSHSYDITINSGEFNGKITTPTYIACGVYVANSGKVTLNGGVFNIEGGVGVLVRSGELVANKVEINLTEKDGLTEGKVGDSTIVITDGSQIVLDDKAGYPGSAPVVSENKTSYVVKGVDGKPITNAE